MRISWLVPGVIASAREALHARSTAWDEHFSPHFEPPPMPPGVDIPDWDRITEHVARAERVSEVVREEGVDAARARFGDSPHAVELATLASAALVAEELDLTLIETLLGRGIDDLVFYAPFLELLMHLGADDQDRAITAYEAFTAAYELRASTAFEWRERVNAVRDGLASAYVAARRFDEGHELFEVRHAEDTGDVAVALSASRSFLAAGEVARAVHWLGLGAERAQRLGRAEMAETLRGKAEKLRQRLS